MDSSTEQLIQYHGNCHCGLFKFSIRIPQLEAVYECNCSICTRTAYKWIFPIEEENVLVETGEGTLRSYEFASKATTHFFCPACGSTVMAKIREALPGGAVGITIGVNARMLKDVDLDTLEILKFNGVDLGPKYQPPKFPAWEGGEVADGLTIYNGNCHCSAVTYAVKTKPLTELKVMCCNCSLCSRNGDLWIYPPKGAVHLQGDENLIDYTFLDKNSLHSFCSTCGVSVVVKVTVPGEDVMPLNVRTIDGIDLEGLQLQKYDGRSNDPQYLV